MAGSINFTCAAFLAVVMMISVLAKAAEEAEAPSPSMLTGAASMAVCPSVAAAALLFLGSFFAFLASSFY